ncbi:MAG: transcriptional regulator [Thermodesulfovibrionia bacterium]|nr:MAG: transcriptional regulator [Thermodesulfovibrionia bacterium]
MKPKKPFVPVERQETVRKQIISVLEGQTLSAKEISALVKVSEKEVYSHLEHIQKTKEAGQGKKGLKLIIIPAECRKCRFVFKKRDRLKKPGKCPVCHGEFIHEPLFSIRQGKA